MPPIETESEAATETLSIRMPSTLAAKIRARVGSGEFASESDVVVHDLLEIEEWNWLPDEPLGSFDEVLADIPAQLARIDSGEERTYTVEEVRESLALRRAEFLER